MLPLLNSLLEAVGSTRKPVLWLQQLALDLDFVEDVQVQSGASCGVNFHKDVPYVLLITFKNGATRIEPVPEDVDFENQEVKSHWTHNWPETLERYMKKHKPGGRMALATALKAACYAAFGKELIKMIKSTDFVSIKLIKDMLA